MMAVGALSACGAGMATVSTKGSAYVVRNRAFGSDMYYCTAESGQPVCTEVEEK